MTRSHFRGDAEPPRAGGWLASALPRGGGQEGGTLFLGARALLGQAESPCVSGAVDS